MPRSNQSLPIVFDLGDLIVRKPELLQKGDGASKSLAAHLPRGQEPNKDAGGIRGANPPERVHDVVAGVCQYTCTRIINTIHINAWDGNEGFDTGIVTVESRSVKRRLPMGRIWLVDGDAWCTQQ